MLYELKNDRAFHLSKILGMAAGMGHWNKESNIIVEQGTKGTPNVARTIRALVDVEKKYRLADGKSVTGQQLIDVCEKYEKDHAGEKCVVVRIGNHRVCGLVIGHGVYNYTTEPQVIEVSATDGAMMSVQSHAGNRYTSTLAYEETLDLVSEQIKNGKFSIESQVRKMFGDGTGQKLWAHHKLLALGVEKAKVLQTDKEDARKAAATINAPEAVDKLLAEKAAKGGNRAKVLKGESIKKAFDLCLTGDAGKGHIITRVLQTIVENNEMALVALIAAELKTATPVAEPAPKAQRKGKA